jgi:hypothetical protein
MKRFLALSLALLLSLSLASCEESTPAETPITIHPDAEKYYDYLSDNYYKMSSLASEAGSEGFSDSSMAAFAIMELLENRPEGYDSDLGFPTEDFDAVTQKYLGATIQNFDTQWTCVIPETGNVTSTGWGFESNFLCVLKELEVASDGVRTAIFYVLNACPETVEPSVKYDLLQGSIDGFGYDPPNLIKIVFEEKTDENGAMYFRYHSVQRQGEATPPYTVYQGDTNTI